MNDFNSRLATAMADFFPANVRPLQGADGKLYFKSPRHEQTDAKTHAIADLEPEVKAALERATPSDREALLGVLVDNLETQIKARYRADSTSLVALTVVGALPIIEGVKHEPGRLSS